MVFGDSFTANEPGVNIKGGKKNASPIDFAAEQQALISRSTEYGALADTNEIGDNHYGQLKISAPDRFNVVHLDASTLAKTNYIEFNIAQNATLIINISGSTVNVPSFSMNNGRASQVLFNFYEASEVNIAYTSFFGTILAPRADVHYAGAELYGTLIAKSFSGGVEMHLGLYEGEGPPPSPTPTATPTPSPSPTPTPTVKPTPTVTPTPTVKPTPTVTPTPTVKPTPTVTPTPTVKPTPTVTPTPTVKPTPTIKPSPTPVCTPTPKPTPTVKPTPTPTVKPTPTPTVKPTPTPTVKPTPTPTVKPTPTPTVK
ncbi:RNA polymerase sigma factor, partial [Paenibacillus sp. FSL R7-277]